jgi:malonyl CoA-acyl carrier protein transacylase/phosphopantetheinyl transferase
VAYSSRRVEGKVAFLFPGEGSQYPGMFADLALCFDLVQRWLDFWHGLYGLPTGSTRTDIVFPSSEIGAEGRSQLEHRLHDMDVGSEAVFIGGMAMHELLTSLGVEADVMMGHSSGESAALGACGANPATSPQELASCISQHFAVYEDLLKAGKIPTGALLAVGALPPATVEEQLAAVGEDVVVAMDNCANQMVLYGPTQGIARVQKALTALGGICMPLPFDRGYHTPDFADASAAFLKYYKSIKLGRPKVPLYSCASVGLFPDSASGVRQLAAAQWSQKVRFRETVAKMHDDGVRLFIEVGPSANLTAFVNDILIDREYVALSSNTRRKNGVEQLLSVLGQLYVAGRGAALDKLFAQREIALIDLDGKPSLSRPPLLDNTMPMVRLTEADRELVRRLAAPPLPSVAATSPPVIPAAAAVAAEQAERSAPVDDGRERVMADYFDVMRGFLDQQRTLVERIQFDDEVGAPVPAASGEWSSTHAVDGYTPMLDAIIEHDESHVLARSDVSLRNDKFVRDHVLSGPVSDSDPELLGLACVPFMVSLELMAEACALLAGRIDVRVIENVKAFDWIALDDGELSIQVRADVIDREQGLFSANVVTPRGMAVSAEFRFAPEWRLSTVAPLVEPRPWGIAVPHMYAPGRYAMFQGPVFQSMREIEAWDETGIDVQLSEVTLADFFAEGHTPSLVLNPVLLDALGQVVPCWLVQYVGPEFHSFPSTIGRIELYEPCPADRSGVVMRARQRPADPASADISAPRTWQFECVDGEGRVLLRGDDMVNLFFRVTPSYHAGRTDPLGGWFGGPVAGVSLADVGLWSVPMMPDELCTQSGGICMRIVAHAILDMEERDEWRAVKGALRHRREWLFGRAALKEAVRHWVYEQTGDLLYPSDIRVRHDERGAPFVDGWWCESLIAAPEVSLSHSGNVCLAAVASPAQAVGVDLEELGRVRQTELLVETLREEERPLVQGLHDAALHERVLRLWCAKEAAAKSLGIGLQGQPWAFHVVSADAVCEKLLVAHELGTVEVRVVRRENTIIAVGVPALSDIEVHG